MSMTLFTNLKSGNFLSLSFTSAVVLFELLEIDWPHEDGRLSSISIGRLKLKIERAQSIVSNAEKYAPFLEYGASFNGKQIPAYAAKDYLDRLQALCEIAVAEGEIYMDYH